MRTIVRCIATDATTTAATSAKTAVTRCRRSHCRRTALVSSTMRGARMRADSVH